MIVEVEASSVEYLKWTTYDWLSDRVFDLNIAYCDEITVERNDGYYAKFKLDNSNSDQTESSNTDRLFIVAERSTGSGLTTFGHIEVTDVNGVIWTILSRDIKARRADGTELKITSSYYDYNAMGTQVLVNRGKIETSDRFITVNANTVVVEYKDGRSTTEYIRYSTNLFRQFYQTLLYINIENSYTMSEADEKALIENPDNWLMTLTFRETDGTVRECKFYYLTGRKAYVVMNGVGGSYILNTPLDKIVSDAERFFNYEIISPTDKF